MLSSMTGYGRGQAGREGLLVQVEVRTLNHRFLDMVVRLPASCLALEDRVKAAVKQRLARGRVEVHVTVKTDGTVPQDVQVDHGLLRGYQRALEEVAQVLGLHREPDWSVVVALPGLLNVRDLEPDQSLLAALLDEALQAALEQVVLMRRREGEALASNLRDILTRLKGLHEEIQQLARQQPELIGQRLKERLAGWPEVQDVDPQRLALEVALLAEKADISEEVHRFRSHLDQCFHQLEATGAVGRRLDFLAQEMHRELNTMAAKAADARIHQRVVEGKVELERLREQVQNVE